MAGVKGRVRAGLVGDVGVVAPRTNPPPFGRVDEEGGSTHKRILTAERPLLRAGSVWGPILMHPGEQGPLICGGEPMWCALATLSEQRFGDSTRAEIEDVEAVLFGVSGAMRRAF